jgi:thiol-disulfide isomerase/thioredoxin
MEFLKRQWSTLILIGALAAYLGFSMGTDKCPVCLVSNVIFDGLQNDSGEQALVVGDHASPDWQAVSIDGERIGSDTCKGKVALIVYWATWCAPCLEEIPALIALRNEFAHDEVEIVGVSLDQPAKNIKSFAREWDINYTIVRDNESLDQAFGPVRYIPTLVVLDRDGETRQRYTGLVGESVVREQIEALLSETT